MSSDTVAIFQNELNLGEQILWSGQPQQGLLFRNGDMFFVPFSWLWGGMVMLGFASILFTGQSLVPLSACAVRDQSQSEKEWQRDHHVRPAASHGVVARWRNVGIGARHITYL